MPKLRQRRQGDMVSSAFEELLVIDEEEFRPPDGVDNAAKAVFVGLSMGSFSEDLKFWKGITEFAFYKSNCEIVVLVCDRINRFNEKVFSKRSLLTGSADRYSLENGRNIQEFLSSFFAHQGLTVPVIQWDDIHDAVYDQDLQMLRQCFHEHSLFHEKVSAIARRFFQSRRPTTRAKDSEIQYLVDYILWELPSLLQGIRYGNKTYNFLIHPVYSVESTPNNPVKPLIHDIFYNRDFAEIRACIDLAPVTLCDIYYRGVPYEKGVESDDTLLYPPL